MKSAAAFVLAASASLASAQITTSPNGTITCAIPNGVYCAGDSLNTNIIIRCDAAGVGHPGNCNDNLAGEPPLGVNYAPCYQPNATAGMAACSKNCIVYGGSGNIAGTFTLPNCTPAYSTTTSSASSTSASSGSSSSSASSASGSFSTSTTTTTTGGSSTSSSISTTSASMTTSFSSVIIPPMSTGSSGGSGGSNGTVVTVTTTSISATATPPSPTTSQPGSVQTAGASLAYAANGALFVAGLFAAIVV